MRDSVQSIGDPKEPTSKVATHVEFTREPSGLYSRGMDRAETDGLREAVNRHGRDHPYPRTAVYNNSSGKNSSSKDWW